MGFVVADKGDSNNIPDQPVEEDKIEGVEE